VNGDSWKMCIMYLKRFCRVRRLLVFVNDSMICVGSFWTWSTWKWEVNVDRGSGAAAIVWNSDR
jgi:hypothetical protein